MRYDSELYHYGVKGMKWGQNIFGDPYEHLRNAQNKYRSSYANMVQSRGYARQANAMAGPYRSRMGGLDSWASDYARIHRGPVTQQLRYAQSVYNNALARERMQKDFQKASQLAANAYSNAAKQEGGSGKNIYQFYKDAIANAKNSIQQGASIVAKYGNQAVENIKNLGKNSIENSKKWLDVLMPRMKNNKSEEEEESTEKRDYTVKLSGNNYSSTVSDSSEDKTKKKKTTKNSSKSSKSSKSSRSSGLTKVEKKTKTIGTKKKLQKVYRSVGKMDMSVDAPSNSSKYLADLKKLRG